VLLHVLATLALFLALLCLVGDARAAAMLALLFALHPANAEAVAWINGRSEMLALGFGALAIWAACTRRFVVLGVALLAAMLGKETGIVFAPVAVALAGERRGRALVAAALAVAAYASLRTFALGHATLPLHGGSALATLGPVWARTTFAALVPWRRAPIELSTWNASLTPAARAAWAIAGATLAAAALVLAARPDPRRRLAAIALAWWLGATGLVAPIAALDYPWPGLGRWLYVGLPGLLLVAALAARALPPRARVALAAVVAALFVVATQRSIATWHDDEALYSAMVAETPTDAWAWRALGTVRLSQSRDADAAACFHRAVETDRTEEVHAAYALEAYAWARLGRCDAAVEQFRAHPVTPALRTEDFDAAAEACRARLVKALTPPTRRVKSTHANGETGRDASTKR